MLMADYPDTFISVDLHVYDDYEFPWTQPERRDFYGVGGIPDVRFDGLVQHVGTENSDQETYDVYLPIIQTRWNKPTDITIDLSVSEVAAQTYRVSATVGMEPGGVDRDMVVHFLQVLNNYPTSADDRNHNCARQHDETTISLTSGGSIVVDSVDFYIDGDDWANQDDVKFIVWAQDALASGPAEVYQAAQHDLSADAIPGDIDGDGDVDLNDLGLLLAAYGTCTGDPDFDPAADIDESGCVDLSDLGILLANYGTV